MSDLVSRTPEEPDARPVKERSSAFVDGVAYLEFVRLKSMVSTRDAKAAAKGACAGPGFKASNGASNARIPTESGSAADAHADSQIDIDDWDSLFDAVESRLRDTVEKPDLATTPSAAKDNASRVKSVVLDCVSALDKLHNALRQERSTHAAPCLGDAAASYKPAASLLTKRQNDGRNN